MACRLFLPLKMCIRDRPQEQTFAILSYTLKLMMMQPFMTMDDLSVSVLSDKDKADLYKIADALPKRCV